MILKDHRTSSCSMKPEGQGQQAYTLDELHTILARADALIERLIPLDIWAEIEPREEYEMEFARWIHRAAHKQKAMIMAEIKRLSTH